MVRIKGMKLFASVLGVVSISAFTACSKEHAAVLPKTDTVTSTISGEQPAASQRNLSAGKVTKTQCSHMFHYIVSLEEAKYDFPEKYSNPREREKFSKDAIYWPITTPIMKEVLAEAKPDPYSKTLHRKVKDLCPTDEFARLMKVGKILGSYYDWSM